jgi:hypothetical protein
MSSLLLPQHQFPYLYTGFIREKILLPLPHKVDEVTSQTMASWHVSADISGMLATSDSSNWE